MTRREGTGVGFQEKLWRICEPLSERCRRLGLVHAMHELVRYTREMGVRREVLKEIVWGS